MADDGIEERLQQISRDVQELSAKLTKKKDWWDRLSALSPFIGGVLIAGVGLYFTITSQSRQIEINEVDLAVKFFPYITAKDADTRTHAYSIIQAVGGTLLITKLAPVGGTAVEPALLTAQSQTTDNATQQSVLNARLSVKAVAGAQAKLGLVPDGILGPATQREIMKFQTTQGIEPTGLIDNSTIKALGIENAAR